jgi:CRISPR/Cas system-associated exonuclease Cas4 (RecB family)
VFIHLDTINPVELKTIEGPKGRFYITPEGNKYPSITTILGAGEKPWLNDWRSSMGFEKADKEMKRAAERGTAVHSMIEKFLDNDPAPSAGHKIEHIPDFNMLRVHLRKVNNILTQESALWSDTLRCAGRVDCIGEYKGKLAIIDFKTSTNDKKGSMIEDYYLQTTAYALMFQERYGIQIDDLVILMSVEKGAVPLVFQRPIEPYIEPLLHRINTWHTTYGAK